MYRFLIKAETGLDAVELCRARGIRATTIKQVWPERYLMEAADHFENQIVQWFCETPHEAPDSCLIYSRCQS